MDINYKDMIKLKEQYYEEYKNQIKKGSYDYYLYHDKENEDKILWYVVLTPLAFLFVGDSIFGGCMGVFVLWIYYFLTCCINNENLNRDPLILKKRDIAFKLYLQANHII